MSRKPTSTIATIGIDPGKNTMHLVGLDTGGAIVLREKVARDKVVARLANVPRGRDFAAWLGLVPRQMSTGDRTILGRITKPW